MPGPRHRAAARQRLELLAPLLHEQRLLTCGEELAAKQNNHLHVCLRVRAWQGAVCSRSPHMLLLLQCELSEAVTLDCRALFGGDSAAVMRKLDESEIEPVRETSHSLASKLWRRVWGDGRDSWDARPALPPWSSINNNT